MNINEYKYVTFDGEKFYLRKCKDELKGYYFYLDYKGEEFKFKYSIIQYNNIVKDYYFVIRSSDFMSFIKHIQQDNTVINKKIREMFKSGDLILRQKEYKD